MKLDKLTGSHHWSGSSILGVGGVRPGSPPSWHAAWSFTRAYFKAVWMEYLVVVLVVGGFRGWLFPIGGSAASWGVLAVLLTAVVGTLVVIPTAGEIPIMQGLALAGLGAGPLGALLITLPAISIPSMVLVGRAMGWRVTLTTAGMVAAGGVLAGGTLWALT